MQQIAPVLRNWPCAEELLPAAGQVETVAERRASRSWQAQFAWSDAQQGAQQWLLTVKSVLAGVQPQ